MKTKGDNSKPCYIEIKLYMRSIRWDYFTDSGAMISFYTLPVKWRGGIWANRPVTSHNQKRNSKAWAICTILGVIRVTSHGYHDVSGHHWQFNSLFALMAKVTLLAICGGNPPVTGGFPSQRACDTESVYRTLSWRHHQSERIPVTGTTCNGPHYFMQPNMAT